MAYAKTIWANNKAPAISSNNLKKIENGLFDQDARITTAEGEIANGWNSIIATLSFASYDATTKTGVIDTSVDLTAIISLGMKLKFTQSTVQFGKIVEITSTNMTVFFGTDYSLVDSAITLPYYSMLQAPYGFPSSDDKWTITKTQDIRVTTNTPVVGNLYDTGLSITLPKGDWKVSVHCGIKGEIATVGNITPYIYLTPNRSETYSTKTETDLIVLVAFTSLLNVIQNFDMISIPRTITTPKTYYLTYGVNSNGISYVQTIGDTTQTTIKAVCAY